MNQRIDFPIPQAITRKNSFYQRFIIVRNVTQMISQSVQTRIPLPFHRFATRQHQPLLNDIAVGHSPETGHLIVRILTGVRFSRRTLRLQTAGCRRTLSS